MKKLYKSRSSISINVVLRSKKSMHISFTSQSDGSSVYATDNEEEQYALEHHYKFGKLFKLVDVGENNEEAAIQDPETMPEQAESAVRKVRVSDIAAAKDFLADTFGISRTSLRSEKSIMEAAKANNVEFEGLD
ncbi:MAG TPA: hypothetical protein IAA99_03445 [Candidatus Avibacteroides faecavium]|nr:hypothetical protein [Candidatus Avibacteroides faecavium]